MVNRPCVCHEHKTVCDCDELRSLRIHPKAITVVAIFVILFTLAMAITAARF